jgi:allophanate hydrolase
VTAVLIRAPGPQTTVQDLGRPRARRQGVPLGGAADAEAHALALALAGAPPDAPALEFRLAGPTLAVEGGPVRAALAGAAGRVTRADGRTETLPPWRSVTLGDGDALAVGATAGTATGTLALWPAPDVPAALGSRGTMLRAGFGGWRGRALAAGDRLPLAGGAPAGPERAADWAPADGPLRAVPGPQTDHFTAQALAAFFAAEFVVAEADRMGARLTGPRLVHSALGPDLMSEGLAPGSVQVPGDGLPILLGVDAQTVGGYPKIAVVIAADLPRIGRLRPGDALRFAAVDAEAARAAWAQAKARAAAAVAGVRAAGSFDAAALAGAHLAGAAVDAGRPDHFPHALPGED